MKNRAKGTSNQYSRVLYAHVDICSEWLEYQNFKDWALSSGYADNLSIDRIDNSKGYHPDNCRWATNAEQQQNRGVTKFNAESIIAIRYCYEVIGKTISDLARAYKSDPSTINKIVKYRRWKNIPSAWHIQGV
jgi:hypothetical protein